MQALSRFAVRVLLGLGLSVSLAGVAAPLEAAERPDASKRTVQAKSRQRENAPLANTLPRNVAAAVDQAVQAEMSKQSAVGLALGIVHQGKIVYLKGYGLADREKQIPVTTQTVFNWASNSKPVGGLLAMQLVEQKKLDLDADIRNYVPQFPDKGAKITTRHLLCHTSGIPHYSNGVVIPASNRRRDPRAYIDPVASLDRFALSPLLYKPGDNDSYSSYAYVLLSAVIQNAGKQPFYEQLNQRIVKPLGLKSLQADFPYKGQPNWTVGYEKKGDRIVPAGENAHYWKHAAGGFKSDIEDFAKWAQGLVTHKLVKPETAQDMWKPQRLNSGKEIPHSLGFSVGSQRGQPVISHNGSQDETKTRMVLWPATGDAVVVLCNSNYVDIGEFEKVVTKVLK